MAGPEGELSHIASLLALASRMLDFLCSTLEFPNDRLQTSQLPSA
jgi:hypothetical protein